MKICILYSGGLDSFLMYQYAKVYYPDTEIKLVWFNIGQPNGLKELEAVFKAPKPVDIKSVDWDSQPVGKSGNYAQYSSSIWIPGRNLVLAVLASAIYLPDEIWLGAMDGEAHQNATDKNEKFTELLNELMAYVYNIYGYNIKLRMPFVEQKMSKLEATKWALENGVSVEEIKQTQSCLSDTEHNCGTCIVCIRRWGIFGQLGFSEEYETNILSDKNNIMYLIDLNNGIKGEKRKQEVIPYLQSLLGADVDVGEWLEGRLFELT